jgi:hydroxyquinol 1,2-dioxygenase
MNTENARRVTAEVLEQVEGTEDARLREIFSALVRHLHAFMTEVEPSVAEWEAGIDFLTRTGQFCTPTRQEFILLSDTLGVSSLVNALNQRGNEEVTDSTVLGPFFVAGAPEVELGADIALGAPGVPLYVSGEVRSEDGTPLSGASIDTWQSDSEGFYDVQLEEGTRLRAKLYADEAGRFSYWTVVPSSYPIPHDGPVGAMLRAQRRHPFRPAHLHFKIAAPGHEELVTHLFPSGDEYLDSDAVFSVSDSLIKDLEHHDGGVAPDGRVLEEKYATVDHAFVLARLGAPPADS